MTSDLLPEDAGLIYYKALPAECFVLIPVLSEHLQHGDVIAKGNPLDDDTDFAVVVDFDSKGPIFGFLEIRGDEAVPVRSFSGSYHWAWWGNELDLTYHILDAPPARDHVDRDYRMSEDELNQRLARYRDVIGRRESELPDIWAEESETQEDAQS